VQEEDWIEIYASSRRGDCDERALVLMSVGIPVEVRQARGLCILLTAPQAADAAALQLAAYVRENRPKPPPLRVPVHPDAWMGCALYAVVLVGIAHAAAAAVFGVDWFAAGMLTGDTVRAGALWRVVTALTLHADSAHLLSNLGFGITFGYLLGQLIGPGIAWAGILASGAAGNLLDAALMPVSHRALGASTAVFATLGMLAGYAWGRPALGRRGRWAPLIGAIALLALTGSGGERTDVLGHLTGFAAGTALGAWFARLSTPLLERPRLQQSAAAATLAVLAAAWALALSSTL